MYGSVNRSGSRSRIPNLDPSRHRSSSVSMYSRDSYGYNGRRASSEERKSVSTMRRSSNVRNSLSNEPKGACKEMRPLTDKAYQKKKTGELCEFLLEMDFKAPVPITQTKLMQPSKKEYEMIFQFLVGCFDPTFQLKNLEEDAPRVLKNLGYPFVPNKSVFMYCARTSFSSLLGVLLFLMDHAKFAVNLDLSKLLLTGDSDRPDEHNVLMTYIFECYPGPSNDTENVGVFEKIIRHRGGHSNFDLEKERDSKKKKLEDVQERLESIEQLEKRIKDVNVRIKQYEDYFLGMEKCKEKKEAAILKLTEELEEKKTILHKQEEELIKKQAMYDAQGFDGKKHIVHFEELKKELNETLQQKKAALKKIQEECWNLDIEYTKILHKGDELCKDLIHKFSEVADAVETNFLKLRNIKDPQVQDVCNKFRIELPECPTDSSQRAFMAWIDTHKESLEEIHKKIVTATIIIKTVISAKSEELTTVEMKKLQLSTKLKCSSSVEVQKEHDLSNLERQAVEEVRVLKDECDKDLAKLEKLQKDKREKLDKLRKLKADMQEVEKIKESKSEMLKKYKEDQKQLFANLNSKLEASAKQSEEYGLEILAEFEKLTEKYKRETS